MSADRASWAARLRRAFDEVQFGPSKTLNLREALPTAEQAVARTDAWLRERQVARAGEVLVITGRGNASDGGVSAVREAVARHFTTLRRRGVITAVQEHTPGSFVVRLAPVTSLLEGGQRKREPQMPRPRDPAVLEGLDRETRQQLRGLAERSLEVLGARDTARRYVVDEMVRQFTVLAPGLPEGADRERHLRAAIRRAMEELDEEV